MSFGKATVNVAAAVKVALSQAPSKKQLSAVLSFKGSLPMSLLKRLESRLQATEASQLEDAQAPKLDPEPGCSAQAVKQQPSAPSHGGAGVTPPPSRKVKAGQARFKGLLAEAAKRRKVT